MKACRESVQEEGRRPVERSEGGGGRMFAGGVLRLLRAREKRTTARNSSQASDPE
ncbi:UNVERIFIED_CONTAM: hypothetical protein Sangu_3249000 [Sesamum angustifolium]|uniref:Uncharacterized protein n=1 Tax=Sesamum angustifolium TaxID=2727405 RepID=A0AAW2JEW0_9LAMI